MSHEVFDHLSILDGITKILKLCPIHVYLGKIIFDGVEIPRIQLEKFVLNGLSHVFIYYPIQSFKFSPYLFWIDKLPNMILDEILDMFQQGS